MEKTRESRSRSLSLGAIYMDTNLIPSKPLPSVPVASRARRLGYLALGLTSTGLGVLGAFLPVMPTTCFLLAALWAFSKSSPRLHSWLWHHPRLGASLRRWQEHRCIPREAKVAAIVSMLGSLCFVVFVTEIGAIGLSATIAFMGLGAFFVLRAPSTPRGRVEDCPFSHAASQAVPIQREGSRRVSRV